MKNSEEIISTAKNEINEEKKAGAVIRIKELLLEKEIAAKNLKAIETQLIKYSEVLDSE